MADKVSPERNIVAYLSCVSGGADTTFGRVQLSLCDTSTLDAALPSPAPVGAGLGERDHPSPSGEGARGGGKSVAPSPPALKGRAKVTKPAVRADDSPPDPSPT